jgi:hypothetical protein
MATFARSGSLQSSGQVHLSASFQKRSGIVLPHCFVKIGGQKETGFIQKHWIDAHDEIMAMIVLTPQMPPNRIVSYGKKTLVGTFGTFDSVEKVLIWVWREMGRTLFQESYML